MEPTVIQELTALRRMPLDGLRQRWRALFGREPPKTYRREQLLRRLAWRVQELHCGGLSEAAGRRLREIADADELASGRRPARRRKKNSLAPGTRLIRHWRGVEHVVTATADGGFDHAGRCYRTLTAVAKAITGQHCSGPRFFGLAGTGKGART